jgi:hypothetical protein
MKAMQNSEVSESLEIDIGWIQCISTILGQVD